MSIHNLQIAPTAICFVCFHDVYRGSLFDIVNLL